MNNVRPIVHSKLKLFIFKLRRITYLRPIIKRITRLTRIFRLQFENGHFCYNECRARALIMSWVFAYLLLMFHKLKIIFKLTIDISMGKIY